MAREEGFEAWEQNFLPSSFPRNRFYGVFANASLFHVPEPGITPCAENCTQRSNLAAFCLVRTGTDIMRKAGITGATASITTRNWRRFMREAGFTELNHYYRPAGPPREQQPWLASVWRK